MPSPSGSMPTAARCWQWNAACVLAFYFQDPSGASILRRMLDRAYLVGAVGRDENARELVGQAMVTALNAVVALGDAGFADAVEALVKGDPDADVRFAASQALGRLKKGK